MYCKRCGNQIKDDVKFCPYCGVAITSGVENLEQPSVEQPQNIGENMGFGANDVAPASAPAQTSKKKLKSVAKKEKKAKKSKPEADKNKKKSAKMVAIILGAIAAVVTVIAIVVAVACFPAEIAVDMKNEYESKDGIFKSQEVLITANQPITSVYYSFDPKDAEDLANYTRLDGKGMCKKTVTIPETKLSVGESVLYIYVQTLFKETYVFEVKCEFEVGYVSPVNYDMVIETFGGSKIVSNEIILIAKDGTGKEKIKSLIAPYGGEIVGEIYLLNEYQIRFDNSGESFINDVINELKANSLVESVSQNIVFDSEVTVMPNDSGYSSEWSVENPSGDNWGLECIDAPTAWDYNEEMVPCRVGIIDSYLDYNHEDLLVNKNRVQLNQSNDFKDAEDIHDYFEETEALHVCNPLGCSYCSMKGHGTHVAGIIGAIGNNKKGVAGVNWHSDIFFYNHWSLYKTSGYNGTPDIDKRSSLSDTSFQIAYLVFSNCRVINMSYGSSNATQPSEDEKDSIALFDNLIWDLEKKGYDFLLVKAAGNSEDNASNYSLNRMLVGGEHSRAHTIIVGSIAEGASWFDGKKSYPVSYFSNYGDIVDVFAPGSEIYSTVNSGYDYKSGTSMATPMVTGAISVLYSIEPDLTYDEAKRLICNATETYCRKDFVTYPVLNLGCAVKELKDIQSYGNFEEIELPKFGHVYGAVYDAVSQELLVDARVVCIAEDGSQYFADLSSGVYDCALPQGTYDMEFSCEGYVTETIYNVAVTEGNIQYNMRLNMVETSAELGAASGRIIDAFDGNNIPGATIKVYRGVNNTSGSPAATITSDEYGLYKVNLEPGNYTLCASKSGYQTGSANIVISANMTMDHQDCTITPVLNDGEIRIVLTWNEYPTDLDSHLVGPAPNGGKFHTAYYNQNYIYDGQKYVNLDVDDTTSYGPETTSVYIGQDGTYTFYVHDFTNRNSSHSSSMSESGAQVKVYVAGQSQPVVFNIPNRQGTVWTVCQIKDGQVIPVNEMGYEVDPKGVGAGASVN